MQAQTQLRPPELKDRFHKISEAKHLTLPGLLRCEKCDPCDWIQTIIYFVFHSIDPKLTILFIFILPLHSDRITAYMGIRRKYRMRYNITRAIY